MKLYLVQHGEAQSKAQDAQRPLTEKGHNDIKKMAEFVQQAGVQAAQFIHSGKLRAAQTAEYFAATLDGSNELQINEHINPNDPPQLFLDFLAAQQDDIFLVGHLPYLEKLIALMVSHQEQPLITAFQPGSIVCLEKNAQQQWQIIWMLRPEIITAG